MCQESCLIGKGPTKVVLDTHRQPAYLKIEIEIEVYLLLLKYINTCYNSRIIIIRMKVRRMQSSGNEAIRTQIQPSKPKREKTNITNSQNTKIKRNMVNRVSSYFPKGGHSATETELKII